MPKKSRLIYNGIFKENNNKKLDFTRETCILSLPISVGQPYHELEDLKEELNLLVNHFPNLSLVNILVADTVQRYSLAIKNKKEPENMRVEAQKRGREWNENYQLLIKNKFPKSKVIFYEWDEWIRHELYQEARQIIDELCKDKQSMLSVLLEKDITNFEDRYSNRESIKFNDKHREYCRECLKEECAVLIVWGKCLVPSSYCCLFYPKPMIHSILFICENYTSFMPMFSELKSKSKRQINFDSVNSEEHQVNLLPQLRPN